MEVFAITGPGESMGCLPLFGCWFSTVVIVFLALLALVRKSLGWAVTSLSFAVYQAITTGVMITIQNVPVTPDPGELIAVEDMSRQWVLWSAVGLLISAGALSWVLVKRRQQPRSDPPI